MSYPTCILIVSKEKEIQMETMAVVFSVSPDTTPVLWGVFANYPDADTAVANYLDTHTFWSREDFKIEQLPFGVLL
jgi:hypothetical protein